MLQSIKKLLEAFEQKGIVYCHWKSNEHLLPALEGDTDLDVLFSPSQRSLLDATLNECGLKRFRSTPLMQYNAIEDFIGFDEEKGKIWHLHTHYRMTMGEKHLKGYTITPWTNVILESRRWDDNGIWCSAVETELVLLIVRMTMKLRLRDKGKAIGKDDIKELSWLKERKNDVIFRDTATKMLGDEAAEVVIHLVSSDLKSKGQLSSLHRILLKQFKPFTAFSSFGSRWMRTKREIFWFVGGAKRRMGWTSFVANRRISPSGGLVVAILGCDGAGKSTTLNYVKKEFGKKIDVAKVYFGSGDGHCSLLRMPLKFFVKKMARKNKAQVETIETTKKKSSVKSKLVNVVKFFWAVTLAMEKRDTLKKMTQARNNGMLVLADRYPQTIMAGCNDGPLLAHYMNSCWLLRKVAKWEYNIYHAASINKPDLAIKLVVPTEVAIARKPEMTPEVIEQKKSIVLSMDVAEESVVIDTSRDFEITRSEVMAEIWKRI